MSALSEAIAHRICGCHKGGSEAALRDRAGAPRSDLPDHERARGARVFVAQRAVAETARPAAPRDQVACRSEPFRSSSHVRSRPPRPASGPRRQRPAGRAPRAPSRRAASCRPPHSGRASRCPRPPPRQLRPAPGGRSPGCARDSGPHATAPSPRAAPSSRRPRRSARPPGAAGQREAPRAPRAGSPRRLAGPSRPSRRGRRRRRSRRAGRGVPARLSTALSSSRKPPARSREVTTAGDRAAARRRAAPGRPAVPRARGRGRSRSATGPPSRGR